MSNYKKIKLSKYNIIRKMGEKTIIYNTSSSAILALNKEYSNSFDEIVNNGFTEKVDLCKELLKGNMILDDNVNELDQLLILNKMISFNKDSLTLTIAPTLACNFACPYCYEKGREYITMDENMQEKVVNFIKDKFSDIKSISIAWYGGEPLLAINIIENLTYKIKSVLNDNCSYKAGIVTNGYFLNRDVCEKLKKLDIQDIQVTLDGSKVDHDSRRVLHDGGPTFEKILNNITECCDLIPIRIRMNVDKSNIANIDEILDWLERYDIKNKVHFYLAPVDNINDVCNNCSCMDMSEFSEQEVDFYERALKRGFNCINIPKNNAGICGAISINSFVISPNGNLYKCWNDIGYDDRKVGVLGSEISLNENLTKWLSYNPVHDDECKECNIFPVCFGGCPYHTIVQSNKKCTATKYNIDKTLQLIHNVKTNTN